MSQMSRKNESQNLTVTEKVIMIRKKNKVPQIALAEAINIGKDRISRIERGEEEYTEKHLKAIKEYFMIVGLPITDQECIAFRERLYYWRDLIRAKKFDEANVIRKEVANIDRIAPYALELVWLCKMIEMQLCIAEGDYKSASAKLEIPQKSIDEMNIENTFHYLYNKGVLCVHQDKYEEGLDYLLRAYELMEDDESFMSRDNGYLYYYMAMSYSYLELPYQAIVFWQKARQAHPSNITSGFTLNADRGNIPEYIKTNQIKAAEKLLNKCQIKAESIRDDEHIGMTFFYYGYLHRNTKRWVSAIEYFEKAMDLLPEGTDRYYSSHYHKVHCIIKTRAFSKARQCLDQAISLCNASDVWKSYFEALEHYLKISNYMTSFKNDESIEYILNIAIPYFIKMHDYFTAIDYYSLLETHYEKIESKMKSLLMTKAIHGIYKRCFTGDGRGN